MTQVEQRATQKMIQFPMDPSMARDELNLCEFPLAVLSSRVPDNCLELSYSDRIWDKSRKAYVERNLVVSAPRKYGLPTAKDEEILVALFHMTDKANRWENPTVPLSRYQLIKLLGWNDGGRSYQRIDESMARWKSVTLDYRNAWRDHKNQSWVSELFSIIDNVTIHDSDSRRCGSGEDQLHLPLSSFTWNRVLFDSMQAKYFKRLDLVFYRELQTSTAKRVFRFLDKRFGSGRLRWEFDLREFAFEHIGLSRGYNAGKIKAKLMPAIEELEAKEFLHPMPASERFRKVGTQWRVVFEKVQQHSVTKLSPLAMELNERGVSPKIAGDLLRDYSAERVRKQIEFFDWIKQEKSGRLENPAGFLAESIRQDFEAPAGYQTQEELDHIASQRATRNVAETKRLAEEDELQRKRQLEQERITAARQRLSDDELRELERQVIEEADESDRAVLNSPNLRETYLEVLVNKKLQSEADVLNTSRANA